MQIANLSNLKSFTTLDGSTIRELASPAWTAARHQSLAEASLPAGAETAEHFHPLSEEIYYFTAGSGRMRLGEQETEIRAGDCILIAPSIRGVSDDRRHACFSSVSLVGMGGTQAAAQPAKAAAEFRWAFAG
jgi:uncharacterized RmlC-like cupin family protein